MRDTVKKGFVMLAVLSIIGASTSIAVASQGPTEAEHLCDDSITSAESVRYCISFSESEIVINGENRAENTVNSTIVVSIDGNRAINGLIEMEIAEDRTWMINPKKHINPSQTNHTVTISTFGEHTTYNFTQEVNNTDSGPVPTPEITDVEVTTATIDGEETTVVNATVSNPTIHPYPMVLLASTEETSTYQLASTGPNDSSVVQIPLDEAPGTSVQGELRLNDGNVSEGYDQVQFNGSANESTTHQNQSYTVVQASWDEDPYHYGEDDGPLGGVLPTGPLESPTSLAALAGGILVVGAATRRLV